MSKAGPGDQTEPDVRDADSNAARLQALSLDAVAPLVFILRVFF